MDKTKHQKRSADKKTKLNLQLQVGEIFWEYKPGQVSELPITTKWDY